MRIWLATVGEPIPADGAGTRLHRTGLFAQWLAANGHSVVFFTGTMDHYGRKLRAPASCMLEMQPNYNIVLLEGRSYKRSVSWRRVQNHRDVAFAFRRIAGNFAPPDIILSSYPTEELSRAVLDYAEPRKIPVVLDVRDFWPDIFSDIVPTGFKWLSPLLFRRAEDKTRKLFSRATAVCGMTASAMRWGLER